MFYHSALQDNSLAIALIRPDQSPQAGTALPRRRCPNGLTGDHAMADDREIEEQFWGALEDSPFVMLGLDQARGSAMQPMTAQFEDDDRTNGCIWFFTAKDHDLTRALGQDNRAIASFAAKGHDLFASLRGRLVLDNSRDQVDRLWNGIVAQWYEGKDDPKLALLGFEIDDAKIWQSDLGGFLKPAFNKLFGRKPEEGMKEKVAEVSY
jgi:general stress protein 26